MALTYESVTMTDGFKASEDDNQMVLMAGYRHSMLGSITC